MERGKEVWNLIVTDEAHADATSAFDYYEEQQIGLGEKFLQVLANRFDALAKHPHYYSFTQGADFPLRDLVVDRFPFVIFFEIIGVEVVVYAIHNTNKLFDPKTIRH